MGAIRKDDNLNIIRGSVGIPLNETYLSFEQWMKSIVDVGTNTVSSLCMGRLATAIST